MADDFTRRFQYGLSDLPVEPPDDPNTLFSPNGFTAIGMQRAGQAQHMPAQFRLPARRMPPPYPGQHGLAPGGGQLPEIPVPEWWKFVGPMLQILPRMATGSGGGAERETPECKQQWADARDFCARELAKPFPDRYRTGGYKNVEGCARGYVDERCGGNKKRDGYRQGTNSAPPPKKKARRPK